jgi:hypothetical protein
VTQGLGLVSEVLFVGGNGSFSDNCVLNFESSDREIHWLWHCVELSSFLFVFMRDLQVVDVVCSEESERLLICVQWGD